MRDRKSPPAAPPPSAKLRGTSSLRAKLLHSDQYGREQNAASAATLRREREMQIHIARWQAVCDVRRAGRLSWDASWVEAAESLVGGSAAGGVDAVKRSYSLVQKRKGRQPG
jgi:hypothetical protein